MTTPQSQYEPAAPGLSARLMALARLIQIAAARAGRGGFSRKLLDDAKGLLDRAGSRMRLSGDFTIVMLAGGTGSGKSALFNRLAGANFSLVGITRPVTREPYACVWGPDGAAPLLEWLGVPLRNRYQRASALDEGEDDLTGLVLIDLPDHDSVLTRATGIADQLVGQADMLLWVLDPQKYADAAVHSRYLAPLGGHGDVLAVLLNQADLLDGDQADDCVSDLRRLLESEDLHDVPILVTSALTRAGLDDLRKLLISAVGARRAATARISADVDGLARRFARSAGEPAADPEAVRIPPGSERRLADVFAQACGVSAVTRMLRSVRELRADVIAGWPPAALARRLASGGRSRKARVVALWQQLRSVADSTAAQQAEIGNALTDLADQMAEPLPGPWQHSARAAVRSRAEQIPAALGAAVSEALPAEQDVPGWWRLAAAWQGLLIGAAILGVAWAAAVLAFGAAQGTAHPPALLSRLGYLPWIMIGIAAILLAGWLSSLACRGWARSESAREAARAEAELRTRVAAVAHEMVIMPVEQEIAEFIRFRDELRTASGAVQPSRQQDG